MTGSRLAMALGLRDAQTSRPAFARRRGVDRERVDAAFQAIADWGFGVPKFISMTPRITHAGMTLASVYEVVLPRQQQPILDDRTIHGEIVTDKKKPDRADRERIEMMKSLGYKGYRGWMHPPFFFGRGIQKSWAGSWTLGLGLFLL
jgi:hypothetical protein